MSWGEVERSIEPLFSEWWSAEGEYFSVTTPRPVRVDADRDGVESTRCRCGLFIFQGPAISDDGYEISYRVSDGVDTHRTMEACYLGNVHTMSDVVNAAINSNFAETLQEWLALRGAQVLANARAQIPLRARVRAVPTQLDYYRMLRPYGFSRDPWGVYPGHDENVVKFDDEKKPEPKRRGRSAIMARSAITDILETPTADDGLAEIREAERRRERVERIERAGESVRGVWFDEMVTWRQDHPAARQVPWPSIVHAETTQEVQLRGELIEFCDDCGGQGHVEVTTSERGVNIITPEECTTCHGSGDRVS